MSQDNCVPNLANLIQANRTQANHKTPQQAQSPANDALQDPRALAAPGLQRFDSFAAPWLPAGRRPRRVAKRDVAPKVAGPKGWTRRSELVHMRWRAALGL